MNDIKKHKSNQKCVVICKSQLSELQRVERAIRKFAKENKLNKEDEYKLLVAATEAVNNAIVHGNKMNGNKIVRLSCCAYKKKIVIQVRDSGIGFDASNLPNPTERNNLLKEHGRGVFLVRALMDEVHFRKLKTGLLVSMALRRR